jgi:peptidoglycan/xylan/chitin deacetylase (PgdA/CDA1 family)
MVGESNRWTPEPPLHDRPLLSWEGVRSLRDSGVSIGAHSASHPRLTDLPVEQATREVAESRAILEEQLSEPIAHFAYPYGKSSDVIRRLVVDAGYVAACGIRPGANGPATPLDDLRRIEVEGTWSLPAFALSVWSGFPPRRGRRS